ncbi:MAG: FAD-dependent oxidoreductase [Planctomycetota bacterium]
MRTVTEPSREIPVFREVDVLVCGGGPAGVGAAIAAARHGAKTLIVEYHNCLGGMATSGMMNRLGPYHDQEKIILGGIPWEVVERLAAMGAAPMPAPCPRDEPDLYWIPFDPEALKYILDQMAEEAGAATLFYSHAVAVFGEPGRPQGVIVESKSGRQAIPAKIIIDATGDGDVAAAAGADFEKGRPGDGLMQPMTLLFKMANLDRNKTKDYLVNNRKRIFEEAKARGENLPPYIGPGTDCLLRADETFFNTDQVFGHDGANAKDLSEAMIAARRFIWQSMEYAKTNISGYENAYLSATAAQLGVRESRRVVGEYILTAEDVLSARKFDDAIARYACWIDIHTIAPSQKPGPYSGKGPEPGTSYDIPYRCLVPKGLDNLLVAGRCFSATHEAFASARMIPCCMAMGQAAGAAAALSAAQGVQPRFLDINMLQDTLRQDNAKV